ncbi:hypothetical protein LCGC14_0387450 [marine sediment metagenome]|uniref:Uncharacterized protein n=1 Tax=marine sediment metagenome TaxID=412755 RepID=A0A0F9W9D3_9ZZZZ
MKTIGDLKRDIEHLPDDTPICESCNYELVQTDSAEENEWYCPNERCVNEDTYPVT